MRPILSMLAELLQRVLGSSQPSAPADSGTQEPPRTAGKPPANGYPLGIRNNNPGNIRASNAFTWRGQTGVDGHGFCLFSNAEYGLRALALLLFNYQRKYALTTVDAVIHRWAPPAENNTAAYIAHVCELTGYAHDAVLDFSTPDVLAALVVAIVTHENSNIQPYDRTLIAAAVADATEA